MSTAGELTEELKALREEMADLPERLAEALGQSPGTPPARDEKGRFVGKGQQKKTLPKLARSGQAAMRSAAAVMPGLARPMKQVEAAFDFAEKAAEFMKDLKEVLGKKEESGVRKEESGGRKKTLPKPPRSTTRPPAMAPTAAPRKPTAEAGGPLPSAPSRQPSAPGGQTGRPGDRETGRQKKEEDPWGGYRPLPLLRHGGVKTPALPTDVLPKAGAGPAPATGEEGSGAGETELVEALRALTEAVGQLKEAIEKEQQDESGDGASIAERNLGEAQERTSPGNLVDYAGQLYRPDPARHQGSGAFRPAGHVPGAQEARQGKGGVDPSQLMQIAGMLAKLLK